jgi:hypothetical protein
MFLSLYDEVTNVLCVCLLSHDRYQYDSLILPKQTEHILSTLETAVVMSRALTWCDVTKECLETSFHLSSTLLRKLCVHYANGFDNIESVYLFYNNPVQFLHITCSRWRNGWGTALQTGRSWDQSPMMSLEFLIDMILPAALWPWGRPSL